jgi:hypothetical protein
MDRSENVQRYTALSMSAAQQPLRTAASAIAIINSVVAGTGIAMAVSALGVSALALVAGVVAAIVFVALHLRYERKRVQSVR